jgi:MoxR-like ATPase
MATQNPIEQEGVYALPEAQLDRFMMKLVVTHNSESEELEIMRKGATKSFGEVEKVLGIEELYALQEALEKMHIDPELERYIVQLVSATREPARFGLESIAGDIMYGVSPRASIDLYKAARAKAFLRGNDHVTPTDIGMVIHDVLRHRIVLSYEARAKGMQSDEVITKIVETVPIP